MKNPIIIVGAGGLGREILTLLKALPEWEPMSFLDDNHQTSSAISGLPVLGPIANAKTLLKPNLAAVIAIGDPKVKAQVAARLSEAALYFPVLIHPNAVLMNKDTIRLGAGTVIGAGVILTTDISIGNHVLININTTVGHDVTIGDHSSIMPGVNIAGAVSAGESVLIGAGANIRNGIRLGNRSNIAMGAAVIRNVEPGQTVAGIPAKPLSQ
jgi:sugar O-acyltransferase (sialic acid O-acetyltransferase NeuD family)